MHLVNINLVELLCHEGEHCPRQKTYCTRVLLSTGVRTLIHTSQRDRVQNPGSPTTQIVTWLSTTKANLGTTCHTVYSDKSIRFPLETFCHLGWPLQHYQICIFHFSSRNLKALPAQAVLSIYAQNNLDQARSKFKTGLNRGQSYYKDTFCIYHHLLYILDVFPWTNDCIIVSYYWNNCTQICSFRI